MSVPTSPDSLHPGVDLRHMTSNPILGVAPTSKDHRASHRLSQHLRMSPARSPTSIPSSPTSVHSSSSAIFERDIEPLSPPSPQPHHTLNPHRIPRSKTTEQLEHSVPSVLDSAASILAGMEDTEGDQISVVAPANLDTFIGRSSGFASPIGSFRSRSPSPTRQHGLVAQKGNSLLLSIPPSAGTSGSPPGASIVARPPAQSNSNSTMPPPSIVTSPSADEAAEPSPTTTTREHPETPLPNITPTSSSPPRQSASPHHMPSPQSLSYSPPHPLSPSSPSPAHTGPPSPTHPSQKRLSFMSYADLLTSTPASTLPLSYLTTAASSVEPPPHIPGVNSGLAYGPGPGMGVAMSSAGSAGSRSAATSLRGFVMGPTLAAGVPGLMHGGKRDSIAMLDDVGGEWEREGLGRGLEERLDAAMMVGRA